MKRAMGFAWRTALFIAVAICTVLPAFCAPLTTQPNTSNTVSQCLANVPIVGNGAGTSPICHASGALGAAAFLPSSITVSGVTCTLGSSCTPPAGAIAVGDTVTGGTSNGVFFNSAGTFGNTAAGTNGQLFLGVTSGNPLFATMSGGASITNAGVVTVLTNANLTGAVTSTGNATLLGSFSSANLLGALTDETGTGAAVFGTTPTLATPVINGLATGTGVATANTVSTLVARDGSGNFSAGTITASLTGHASLDLALTGGTMSGAIAMGANNITGVGNVASTTFNGNTFTTGTGVLTLGAGKTATISNTLTFAGTDGSTLNIGTGGTLGAAAFLAATMTINSTTCTLGSSCTPPAPAGTLTGTTLNSTVVTSSLTTVGALGGGSATTGFTIAASNVTWTGNLPVTNSPSTATNTVLGNATSGTATMTALAVGSCSTSSSALIWTTNTGFGCNTSIAAATATTAINATNTAITDDTTTNATMNLTWVTSNTGNLPQKTTSTKLTFNPSTGALSSTSFTGAGTGLTGTAASLTAGNVTTNANLTGAVTSSGNATSLGSFTSANLSGALTDETGTGAAVFAGSPTFTGTANFAAISTTGDVSIGAAQWYQIGANVIILASENKIAGSGSLTKLSLYSSTSAYRIFGFGTGVVVSDSSGNISSSTSLSLTGLIQPNGAATLTCGTGCSSVAGNPQKFVVTTGAAQTSVTANFGITWSAAPVCTVSSNSTASTVDISSTSTTAITFGASVALTGALLNVLCF